MKSRQINDTNAEVILPQDIYTFYLATINKISLTRREVDIISCVLSGRSAKKIASFLSIAPKTVEHHIRNVMLKLDCQSQEGIRDFIEKSGKFTHVKKYYASLLIQDRFELELNKISTLGPEHKLSCLIVYENEQQEKLPLIREVERHLNLAGIKTLVEGRDRYQSTSRLIDKIKSRQVNYIIYSLPIKFIEQSRAGSNTRKREVSDFICATNKYSKSVIILLLDRKISVDISNSLPNSSYIDLTEHGNYYFLVLETLKKLLPDITLDEKISEFKLQYEILNDSFFLPLASLSSSIQIKTEKVVSWNLPRQDHAFVGREKLLDELDKELHSKEKLNRNEPVVVSVCAGLGGVGKTQLVLQYIYHSQHPYKLRAWFKAENLDELKQEYIEFGKMLGYKEEKPSIVTALPYAKKWLSENPGWLLVYDNVNSYEEIREFLPEKGGSVILTTRQKKWPSGFGALDIDVMNEEESIELIQSLIRRGMLESEKKSVKILVEILGYLPLALAQAGAYIFQNKITISEYLEFYRNHEQKLLSDSALPIGTDSLPVAITWNISVEEIVKEAEVKNEHPLAIEVLSVCAYLAPERIPYNLLLAWFKEHYPNLISSELILLKLISQLWKYSMINRETNGDITVHRLVQTVIREQHKKELCKKSSDGSSFPVDWYHILIRGMHIEFSRKTEVLKDKIRQKNLLPHLQMLLNYYEKLWPNDSEFIIASIISDIGMVYFFMGEIKKSNSYYKRALSALEQRQEENYLELACVLDQVGRTYRYLGNALQAKDAHERAVKIKERNCSENHLELAYSLDQLGRDYRNLGDPLQAKDSHERVLKIKEQYYFENYFEMADTLDQLGIAYRHLGNALQAKDIHERALRIKEEKQEKKNHNQSWEYERWLSPSFLHRVSSTLVESHPRTSWDMLLSRSRSVENTVVEKVGIRQFIDINECDFQVKEGNDTDETNLLHNSFKVRKKHYGNMEIAFTLDELGKDYRYLGDTLQAKNVHERALKIKEKYCGKDHISTAVTLELLGSDYRDLKNIQKAKYCHERCLKIREEYYGRDDIRLASILDELYFDYQASDDITSAKELHTRISKIKAEILK